MNEPALFSSFHWLVAGSLSADEKNLINIKALRGFSKTYKNVTDGSNAGCIYTELIVAAQI